MKKPRDKPAVKPSKETCEKCKCRSFCLAEAGHANYICPKHSGIKFNAAAI